MLNYPLLFGSLGFWEILLIVLVFLLLFGGKKIPELMHGLGKGMRSFREGMNEVEDEFKQASKDYESIGTSKPDEEKKEANQ